MWIERKSGQEMVGGGGVFQEAAEDKTFLFPPEDFNIKIREHRAFEVSLCSGENFLWFVLYIYSLVSSNIYKNIHN
jgi:hypothetical protein